jgi:AP-1 complex subunit gamma-1
VEGRQESPGSTRIAAHFNNKTSSYIEQLALQTAVMKYLKIVIQPMSGTNLPPMSKGQVTQVMVVNNSAVGEKAIIMKIKLSYVVNGQKCNF